MTPLERKTLLENAALSLRSRADELEAAAAAEDEAPVTFEIKQGERIEAVARRLGYALQRQLSAKELDGLADMTRGADFGDDDSDAMLSARWEWLVKQALLSAFPKWFGDPQ